MKRSILLAAACALAVPAAWPALAGTYRFREMHAPHAMQTVPMGVNDSNTVVGFFIDKNYVNHGFAWAGGIYTQVDLGTSTKLLGINDRGMAVGSSTGPGSQNVLFTYNLATKATVNVPFTLPARSVVDSAWINNAGRIAGATINDNYHHAAFISSAAGARIISKPPGAPDNYVATGLSSGAFLVGYTIINGDFSVGFTFKSGVSTNFSLPNAGATELEFIRPDAVFGGDYSTSETQTHGFTQAAGKVTVYDYPGASYTDIFGVIPGGGAVGRFYVSGQIEPFVFSGGVYHALFVPFNAKRDIMIAGVNGSGTMIGTYLTSNSSRYPLSFIGLCSRDQVPCTQ